MIHATTKDPNPGHRLPQISATAIVLAGGKSSRMGQDKRLLPFQGQPLLQHVCGQVRRHFDEVLIAANDPARLAFLDLPVVPDESPGQGPLGGITSALAVSRHDLNFVVACDIPFVDFALVERLLREVRGSGCDGAVPLTARGHFEPLFAVYRKSMLPLMRDALAEGNRRITGAFSRARIHALPLSEAMDPRNLNTMEDYRGLLASHHFTGLALTKSMIS